MTQDDDIRSALQHKLEELRRRIGKIERNLRETPEADSEEQAAGRENDEVLERLDDRGREEIQMIEAALARMDAGTYGICGSCGETISSQRLAALPYTTACITCAC
jgi:RNA polymerase-binding protein DksA